MQAMKSLLRFLFWVLVCLIVAAYAFRGRYGGPLVAFPERSTPPILQNPRLEVVATLEVAPGNIAVASDGRIFFTLHPEGRPSGTKLAELVNGKAEPFPDPATQYRRAGQPTLDTPLGIRLDSQGRLWTIDHGMHGLHTPRLLAFDIKSRTVVHQFDFPSEVAGLGSFLQDLAVDPSGRYVYIADAGVMAKKPGLVIYDSVERVAYRRLDSHTSVSDKDYLVNAKGHPMILVGGLFNVHVAVDSIAVDRKGEWLYFGPMSHEELFRVRTADLHDRGAVSDSALRGRVEAFGPKVQTDGITTDSAGNIYLTDIEHGGIALLTADRQLKTLFRDPRIRWPDGLSFGPGGYLYIADSDLPDQMMRTRGHITASAPYYIYRIQVGQSAPAGQ
jgi:sugar lactone lactonase YvrE